LNSINQTHQTYIGCLCNMPQDAGHALRVPLSLHSMFKAHYKCQVIIIFIITGVGLLLLPGIN